MDGKTEKIKTELSYIEPFIEAIPQYIISVCVYVMLTTRNIVFTNEEFEDVSYVSQFTEPWSHDKTEIIAVFGQTTLGVSNSIMFPVSLLLSLVSGVKCVLDYLHNSPLKIASEKKWINIVLFCTKLVYIISAFFCKLMVFSHICAMMIYAGHGILNFLAVFINLFLYYVLVFVS